MELVIRPIRLPDSHLPHGVDTGRPSCRTCTTAWPCETAGEYLSPGACTCGAITYRDKTTPRSWHIGPRCYTDTDVTRWQAAELRQTRAPHYPPSHFYPPKPARPKRQRPPYRHTPDGPGDVQPGTWVWVRPGGLNPGWGDIHHLAMVTALGLPKCEVWLHLDGTMHQVLADRMTLDRPGSHLGEWARWTVAEHLDHQGLGDARTTADEPAQLDLFAA